MALKFKTTTIPTNGDYVKYGSTNMTAVNYGGVQVWKKQSDPIPFYLSNVATAIPTFKVVTYQCNCLTTRYFNSQGDWYFKIQQYGGTFAFARAEEVCTPIPRNNCTKVRLNVFLGYQGASGWDTAGYLRINSTYLRFAMDNWPVVNVEYSIPTDSDTIEVALGSPMTYGSQGTSEVQVSGIYFF